MPILGIIPVIILLAIALFFLLGLLSALWIFRDARRRRIKPLKWILLAILLSVVGLIIYRMFIRRRKRR